jgi:signal transduction histidine kinase
MKALLPKSLKRKVFLTIIAGIFFIGFLVLGIYETFKSINFLLVNNERISEFVDNILEARRFEKNFLLYKNNEDLEMLLHHVLNCEQELKIYEYEIGKFLGESSCQELKTDLEKYKNIVLLLNSNKCSTEKCFEDIREKGRILTQYAEKLNKLKNLKVKESLDNLRKILLIAAISLLVLGIFYSYYLYISISQPLKKLDNYILEISKGKFYTVPPVSQDREIILLVEAINTMLAEIDKRTNYLIQTEKLATLGTFLFGLTHELNNPLNNIYTTCQVLKEELKGGNFSQEFMEDLLTEMEKEIERIKRFVKGILDYSKPGEKREIELKELVEETKFYLKGAIPHRIEVKLEIPENLKIWVDPQQMKQVFINLFKNSIDAIENEGQIKISAEEKENQVVIYFSDTGKGIPADILPKIFEPFFTTKGGDRGYGIGMFIVYHLIKNHGGTIEVESEVNKGTTFIIKLPKKEMV